MTGFSYSPGDRVQVNAENFVGISGVVADDHEIAVAIG
jgi:hypothetical protein